MREKRDQLIKDALQELKYARRNARYAEEKLIEALNVPLKGEVVMPWHDDELTPLEGKTLIIDAIDPAES